MRHGSIPPLTKLIALQSLPCATYPPCTCSTRVCSMSVHLLHTAKASAPSLVRHAQHLYALCAYAYVTRHLQPLPKERCTAMMQAMPARLHDTQGMLSRATYAHFLVVHGFTFSTCLVACSCMSCTHGAWAAM